MTILDKKRTEKEGNKGADPSAQRASLAFSASAIALPCTVRPPLRRNYTEIGTYCKCTPFIAPPF